MAECGLPISTNVLDSHKMISTRYKMGITTEIYSPCKTMFNTHAAFIPRHNINRKSLENEIPQYIYQYLQPKQLASITSTCMSQPTYTSYINITI